MTSLLVVGRPTEWNFPLLVHILGAMILVGGTLTAAAALGLTRGDVRMLRLGYWSLLAVALPGYVLMRIGAEWLFSKEGLDDGPDQAWWIIGFAVADGGALLLLLALILGGVGVRRMRSGKGTRLLKATMVISILLLAAYVVAIWAMGAKPS